MLNPVRRLAELGPAAVNRAVVTVFAVVAALLLGHTWLDSRSVSSDLHNTIAPKLSAAAADPAVGALLQRTGDLTEQFAAGLLPLATALGHAADSTTSSAAATADIREHTRSTADSFANLAATAADLRSFTDGFAPVVVAMVADTGDIAERFGQAQQQAQSTARLLADALRRLDGVHGDARTLREQLAQVEAILGRIERDGTSIAAARPLDCPKTLTACLS